ncbi:DUF1161 domain-containing protein [Enterobacillus tribolii]|uniref:Uncharacterized protein DUF1161 n=1 Tax=Enterobacillus tribolii TaxID=1487935 RepID=A0A370R3Z6_9GAMM|nr:DUF1161 domain-containing protein [Enterobacillus tribolii]MBW7984418.1 DUF1161 domain-containing protein [Enterobacillus tribolii]RDK97156.1 uncharacterized protein DUF1161 [Enterobacillus tribolii]
MKKTLWVSLVMLFVAPLAQSATCEAIKADIAQKIINNGVPESGFTLDIVPNDQVEQAGGLVVGHCGNDTQKIIYHRHLNGDDVSPASDNPDSSDDTAQQ